MGILFIFPRFELPGLLAACVLLFSSSNAMAVDAGNSTKQTRTLDAKVQALKKEVKSLNRDLFILEEELLFPSSTQLAVFVSVDVGNFFRLDSVQLKIDDKIVANHLYTKRELGALERGGVQRLYIGNVKSGEHELIAIFIGPGPNNREYRRGTTLKFNKSSAAKFIELKILDSSGKLQPEFVVKEWE
ncbi:MAG: AraC family transcriptional regulator [Gammaproteobacteria bacterium]|nr:AraC family transcriptional regulator [Gammaproteobacteria bacterium]